MLIHPPAPSARPPLPAQIRPDDIAQTEANGRAQSDAARAIWAAEGAPVAGRIESRHAWVDMGAFEVRPSKWGAPKGGRTCPGAMGFAFAAGTTDGAPRHALGARALREAPHARLLFGAGPAAHAAPAPAGPGAPFFRQGDVNGSALWRGVRNVLRAPSREQAVSGPRTQRPRTCARQFAALPATRCPRRPPRGLKRRSPAAALYSHLPRRRATRPSPSCWTPAR